MVYKNIGLNCVVLWIWNTFVDYKIDKNEQSSDLKRNDSKRAHFVRKTVWLSHVTHACAWNLFVYSEPFRTSFTYVYDSKIKWWKLSVIRAQVGQVFYTRVYNRSVYFMKRFMAARWIEQIFGQSDNVKDILNCNTFNICLAVTETSKVI